MEDLSKTESDFPSIIKNIPVFIGRRDYLTFPLTSVYVKKEIVTVRLDNAKQSFQTSRGLGDQEDVIRKEKTSNRLTIKGKAKVGGGECVANVTDIKSEKEWRERTALP